jgi:hypothetical protein
MGTVIIASSSTNVGFASDLNAGSIFLQMESQLSPNWSSSDIESNLIKQGYAIVSVTNTFLGRVKIRAQNDDHNRILVMAPSTGEILSDRIITLTTTRIATDRSDDKNQNNASSDNITEDRVVDTDRNEKDPNRDGNLLSRDTNGTSTRF